MLYCDNIGAIYLISNLIFHARTKHIELDFLFVREQVANGSLTIQFLSTQDQLVDLFIKPLSLTHFQSLTAQLPLCDGPRLAGGMLDNIL